MWGGSVCKSEERKCNIQRLTPLMLNTWPGPLPIPKVRQVLGTPCRILPWQARCHWLTAVVNRHRAINNRCKTLTDSKFISQCPLVWAKISPNRCLRRHQLLTVEISRLLLGQTVDRANLQHLGNRWVLLIDLKWSNRSSRPPGSASTWNLAAALAPV